MINSCFSCGRATESNLTAPRVIAGAYAPAALVEMLPICSACYSARQAREASYADAADRHGDREARHAMQADRA